MWDYKAQNSLRSPCRRPSLLHQNQEHVIHHHEDITCPLCPPGCCLLCQGCISASFCRGCHCYNCRPCDGYRALQRHYCHIHHSSKFTVPYSHINSQYFSFINNNNNRYYRQPCDSYRALQRHYCHIHHSSKFTIPYSHINSQYFSFINNTTTTVTTVSLVTVTGLYNDTTATFTTRPSSPYPTVTSTPNISPSSTQQPLLPSAL
ncbi:uncharacterized protein LOC115007973 [Cottoperca gobio]|uniref:Uncharacterized protein LOC115007973 n=1 Tax=Cottoperca gobio TaxID=56716 RepID=A0A6J2PNY3_COTGO|nr:uncharacterized protein LOC115007973 [Cottoperca gobio]